MLERLKMESLELSKTHVSFLDVYCSKRAKWDFECSRGRYRGMFEDISQIVIGVSEHGRALATPVLLPSFTLIERTELYGVNNKHLPDQTISDVFCAIFMDTDIPLPEPIPGRQQSPKHSFVKFAYHPNQIGLDIQFEFPPKIALDITKRVRDYLPPELLKEVRSYIRTPESVARE